MEPADLEIMITETPRHDWGIRGKPGTSSDWTTAWEV
jgi:hypothetical protein